MTFALPPRDHHIILRLPPRLSVRQTDCSFDENRSLIYFPFESKFIKSYVMYNNNISVKEKKFWPQSKPFKFLLPSFLYVFIISVQLAPFKLRGKILFFYYKFFNSWLCDPKSFFFFNQEIFYSLYCKVFFYFDLFSHERRPSCLRKNYALVISLLYQKYHNIRCYKNVLRIERKKIWKM